MRRSGIGQEPGVRFSDYSQPLFFSTPKWQNSGGPAMAAKRSGQSSLFLYSPTNKKNAFCTAAAPKKAGRQLPTDERRQGVSGKINFSSTSGGRAKDKKNPLGMGSTVRRPVVFHLPPFWCALFCCRRKGLAIFEGQAGTKWWPSAPAGFWPEKQKQSAPKGDRQVKAENGQTEAQYKEEHREAYWENEGIFSWL